MRTAVLSATRFSRIRGLRRYELSNHLGNVMAVVSDRKVIKAVGRDTLYFADLVSATDYYAFGMVMADRSWNTEGYRYGFNGKENDNEVKGTGNQQDYGMRIYDARLGRFLSVDPLTKSYPELTPYQFASNTPIQAVDLDGLEAKVTSTIYSSSSTQPVQQVQQHSRSSENNDSRVKLKQGLYAITHPYNTAIGLGVRTVTNNIEDVARVPLHTSNSGFVSEGAHNSFRHFLGMAMLTRELGAHNAQQMGDAHEANPSVSQNDLMKNPTDYNLFDNYVDQYNNEKARAFATKNPNIGDESLALKALEMTKEGQLLMVIEDPNKKGHFNVVPSSLTPEEYTTSADNIMKYFRFKQRERMDEVKKALENPGTTHD